MTFDIRVRAGDDVRALWLLAAAIVLGGMAFLHARYENAISASFARTESLYRETAATARLIRQAPRLETLYRQARGDLSRVSREVSLPAATANLLATLYASSRTLHTQVVDVEPGVTPNTPDELQATPLTIRVSGTFRNILRFVEDLSEHATLVSVSDTELALASGSQRAAIEPQLDATIHATLYRLQLRASPEATNAPAR
jgi:Tfp pilus assembly protein PilO